MSILPVFLKGRRRADTDRHKQRGAAMAEMAFVLPVFFLLCWGFIIFAFILFGYCSATYAAKVAVRYASMHGSSSPSPCTSAQLTAIAQQYLWGAPANGVTITPVLTSNNIGGGGLGEYQDCLPDRHSLFQFAQRDHRDHRAGGGIGITY